jgi:hypothetical protein
MILAAVRLLQHPAVPAYPHQPSPADPGLIRLTVVEVKACSTRSPALSGTSRTTCDGPGGDADTRSAPGSDAGLKSR